MGLSELNEAAGRRALADGKLGHAMEHFMAATDAAPRNWRAYLGLAHTLTLRGRFLGAVQIYSTLSGVLNSQDFPRNALRSTFEHTLKHWRRHLREYCQDGRQLDLMSRALDLFRAYYGETPPSTYPGTRVGQRDQHR